VSGIGAKHGLVIVPHSLLRKPGAPPKGAAVTQPPNQPLKTSGNPVRNLNFMVAPTIMTRRMAVY
jgi:hypothetical protein